MSSKSKQVTVKCDGCEKIFQVTHWYKIDGIDSPELKRSILDGSLFVARCDGCGSLFQLEQNIQYSELHHVNKQTFAAYLVSAEDVEKERGYIEFMPLYRKMGARIHVVNSSDELRHLIRSYDAGELPPETVIKASKDPDKNRQHDKQLSEVASSMDKLMSEITSGKMSQDTIDKIKRGRKLMKQNEQKPNLIDEILKDPKKSCIVLGILGCFLALLDMPNEFYAVLRFVVVAASVAAIWLLQKSTHGDRFKTVMSLLLGILAIVFNPVMPLDLEREQWAFFNLAGAGLLLGILLSAKGGSYKRAETASTPIIPTPPKVPAAQRPTTSEQTSSRSPQPDNQKGAIFYRALDFPPHGVKPTLANIAVRVSASVEKTESGKNKYTTTVYNGAKPHHVFEAQSAIFWKTELDEGRITHQQASTWIDLLSQATAKQYWGKLSSDTDKNSETYLLVALAKATVQYAFINAESLGIPVSFVESIKNGPSEREAIVASAEAMDAAIKLDLIDPAFLAQLDSCFRRK
jgi:hypothetical protein